MNWLTLISAAVGVVAGSTVQYLYGQRAEAKRHQREKCADAYAEYLRAIASAAHVRNDIERIEALKAFTAAKTRIVVYGSQVVVQAEAKFEQVGATVGTPDGRAAVVAICRAMRAENNAGKDATDSDLRAILLGPETDVPGGFTLAIRRRSD
jgi:hypothetical protein